MRLGFVTATTTLLTLGSFAADLDGRYVLAALLLVSAVAELAQGVRLLRAQQTPLGRAGDGRR